MDLLYKKIFNHNNLPFFIKTSRIIVAVCLCAFLCPYIAGATVALSSIVISGYDIHNNPSLKEELKDTPKLKAYLSGPVVNRASKLTGYIQFFILGIVYGLVANNWTLAILVLPMSAIFGNTVIMNNSFTLSQKFFYVGIQVLILYLLAFLFSKITFQKKYKLSFFV